MWVVLFQAVGSSTLPGQAFEAVQSLQEAAQKSITLARKGTTRPLPGLGW